MNNRKRQGRVMASPATPQRQTRWLSTARLICEAVIATVVVYVAVALALALGGSA